MKARKTNLFALIRALFITVLFSMLVGCAGSQNPTVPPQSDPLLPKLTSTISYPSDHNRHLWAYGLIKVNEDHSQWDFVPLRVMDFHLNALNLLEQGQCHNCVSIEKVTKLGNGLVDVDVSITHPFPGLAQYTGFDVKGRKNLEVA